MASYESLCSRCAKNRAHTCCQFEIFTSAADVERIMAYTGRDDFFEYKVPVDAGYLPHPDVDPVWAAKAFRADGSRRVLRRTDDGNCPFLQSEGCTLPMAVRPVVCRLFPLDYTDKGVLDQYSEGCPLELLALGETLLGAIGMDVDQGRVWQRQLYDELQHEHEVPSERTCGQGCQRAPRH